MHGLRCEQPLFFKPALRCSLVYLSWFLGTFMGFAIIQSASDLYFSLMRRAIISSVSIVQLMPIIFFPFLIAVYAVFGHKTFLLYCYCFCNGFVFGICSFAIYFAFGNVGWLLQFLTMFTANFLSVLVLFMCHKILLGTKDVKRTLATSFAGCLLIVLADAHFVSRIAMSVIT